MQYCISKQVMEYCANYATNCEPHSVPLRETFSSIVRGLTDDSISLKAVSKLLLSSIGERDFLHRKCHLLLQLPLYKALRDFIVLSLDGSRVLHDNFTMINQLPNHWQLTSARPDSDSSFLKHHLS